MAEQRKSRNIYRRGTTFWARFRYKGHEVRQSLFISDDGTAKARKKAEQAAKKLKEGLAESYAATAAGGQPVIWEDLVEAWLEGRVKENELTTKRYITSLRQWAPHFEGRLISDISRSELRKVAQGRLAKGVSKATLQRDFTALSSLFSWAVDEEWLEDSPVDLLKRKVFKEEKVPIFLPEMRSIEILLASASPQLADLCRFAMVTGMRQAEIAALEWSWVDQESEAACLYRTKRMRLRTISLCPAAFEILEKQPRFNAQSKVFRDENGDDWRQISSKFCALRRKIEEKNKEFVRFRFHDFRHLYAVNYLRAGGDIYALQKLLGHGSIKTTEGYLAFLTPEQNRVAQFGARAQKRAQATA